MVNILSFLPSNQLIVIYGHLKFFLITIVFFVIILRYFRQKWQKHPLWQTLFINLTIFIFLVASVYQGTEVYFRYIFDRSDNYAFLKTHRAWVQKHERLNLDGCRDIDREPTKLPGVTRVVVLGDSFAFGGGLAQVSDRFSNKLQVSLDKTNPGKYEVFNVAFPGADTKYELEKLAQFNTKYKFDIVVLGYVLNDIGLNVDPKIRERSFCYLPGTWCYDAAHPLIAKIMKNSYSLEFFYYRLLGFSREMNQNRQWEVDSYKNPEKWASQEKILTDLINYCRSQNLKLIVVVFPYLQNIKPGGVYPYFWIHQQLGEFFKQENIATVDILAPLKGYQTQKLIVNPLDNHPSAFVHQKVAEALLPFFSQN